MNRQLAGHKAALTTKINLYERYARHLEALLQDDYLKRRIAGIREEARELRHRRDQLDRLNPEHSHLPALIKTVLEGTMPDAR